MKKKYEEAYGESDRLMEKIRRYRQCGLERGGEFSIENLVFKTLHGAQPTVTYKNADFAIAAGENVQVDTRSNPVNITLPAAPNSGDAIRISDGGGNFASLNATILRNGKTIMDLSDDLLVDYNNASFGLSYNGTTWRIF